MIVETQAAFARRMKDHIGRPVTRGMIWHWADAGRIVMAGKLVDVEASLTLLEATQGWRDDVADRHAREAEEKRSHGPLNKPEDDDPHRAAILAARRAGQQAEVRYRNARADLKKMEADEKAGLLIRVEDVNFALDSFGATLRSLLETLPDRLAPVIFPLQSLEETHAALSAASDSVLLEMSELMTRAAHEAEKKK